MKKGIVFTIERWQEVPVVTRITGESVSRDEAIAKAKIHFLNTDRTIPPQVIFLRDDGFIELWDRGILTPPVEERL